MLLIENFITWNKSKVVLKPYFDFFSEEYWRGGGGREERRKGKIKKKKYEKTKEKCILHKNSIALFVFFHLERFFSYIFLFVDKEII